MPAICCQQIINQYGSDEYLYLFQSVNSLGLFNLVIIMEISMEISMMLYYFISSADDV